MDCGQDSEKVVAEYFSLLQSSFLHFEEDSCVLLKWLLYFLKFLLYLIQEELHWWELANKL